MSSAKMDLIAEFPPGSFLENIASCPAGGHLVTHLNMRQVFYIPPFRGSRVTPFLIEAFQADQWPAGIINSPSNPNIFYVLSSDFTGTGSKASYLHIIDMGNPGTGYRGRSIMQFPAETKALNGFCAVSDSVLLAADSFATRIWRIDLDTSSNPPKAASAKLWSSDPMLEGTLVLPDFQPGANGLKYSNKTSTVYFTNTQKRILCGQRLDPVTYDAVGEPQVIADCGQADDFIIDETAVDGPVAYVTTHRDNTILKIPLTLNDTEATNKAVEIVVSGSVENDMCLGPTAGCWEPGKEGSVATFLFDGGLKGRASDGICRTGKVVRIQFQGKEH